MKIVSDEKIKVGVGMREKLYSMGIDVGTTTTQIIFSEIIIENCSTSKYVFKNELVQKEVLYKSEIYFTPFINKSVIDFEKLKYIVENEFVKSGLKKEEISTGAIIITGDAARCGNAKEVLYAISDLVGKFVTVSAGADLEAVFSGYGSGACKISKEVKGRVLNFDLGGATTNISVFNCGEIEDAFAVDIGGRLISFDDEGNIIYISPKIQFIIKKMNLKIEAGKRPDFKELIKLCYRFSTMLIELAGFSKLKMDTLKLFIEHKNKKLPVDFITFSGGVAEYVYKDIDDINDNFIMFYKDIGPILGFCIKNTFKNYQDKIKQAEETISAKVIGAGNNSFILSGETVTFDETVLPLKNVQIIKPFQYETEDYENLYDNLQSKLRLYENTPVAIAFKGPQCPTYNEIKLIAGQIIKICKNRNLPVVVIVENDFARALGQKIKLEINDSKKVICIDKINTNNGDYIDICKNVGEVVTVSIRTLTFNS